MLAIRMIKVAFSWVTATRKRIAVVALTAVALTLALAFSFDTARVQLLRIAEKVGWWKEAEHALVPVRDEQGKIKYWTCTMHTSVRAAGPGKCPICGMDLVPVRETPPAAAGKPSMPAMQMPSPAPTAEQGAFFTVSPERQQLIGVQFSEVSYRTLEKTIRTVGRVELDQQKIAEVHPKISGWIEQVFVDYQWQHVRQGDPLFTLYSPDLVAAQEEYLLALKAQEGLGSSPFPKAAVGARSLLEDARARLRLWDITDEQIQELERTREVKRTLNLYSPISGHVVERNAFPRMRVTPDTKVYIIADHTSVWVHVDLYEDEIAWVHLGRTARMTLRAYPNRIFTGKVTFIWPHLDMITRTLKVRLEFPNPDLTLKPMMYSDVELHIPLGRRLAVPKTAVLPTGERNLVFVDRGEGQMEIRAILLGAETEQFYEVVRGLRLGERVVSAANFLIDAESQIQGAIATWQAQERAAPAAGEKPREEFSVEIREPRQAQVGKNTLRLLVKDASGKPLENAEVELSMFMPQMGGMPPMSASATLHTIGLGEYAGDIGIPIAGTWQTTVTLKKSGKMLGSVRTQIMAR